MITFPESDLASKTHPYRIRIQPDTGAELATVRLHRAAPAAAVIAAEIKLPAATGMPLELRLDVAPLADGEYEGEIELTGAGQKQAWPFHFYRLPDHRSPGIPFGMYAVPYPDDTAGMDATLAEVQQTGTTLLCMHMNGLQKDRAFLDRAARFGMTFCPSSNRDHRADGAAIEWPKEVRVKFPPGAPSQEKIPTCFSQRAVRQQAAAAFADMLRQYRTHPTFSGQVYYGDDLFMASQSVLGKVWLSCYCSQCREDFKSQFGYEPPFTTTAPEYAVVSATDPWLSWMQYRCRDIYGGFIRAIMEAKNSVDPAIQVGLCHGAPDNPFTSITSGVYTPLSQPTDVVSSYFYPYLRSPAADFICHYEFGKMNNRQKDVWMLGLFLADGQISPEWQILQNYWNMLAAGYKFIAFFSWWDYVGDLKAADEPGKEKLHQALAALTRCGAHKDWIFPVAKHWQDTPARVAALYSFTTEACDIAPRTRNHQHMKETCRLYRQMLAKQVPVNLVSEEEVRAGILDQYDALCLHDVRALPDDVHAKVQAFANAGKLVLVDPDYLYTDGWHPSMQVSIRGAIELTPESMAQVLADKFPGTFAVSNPDVTARRFTVGAAEYFVFVNNFPDRYSGMTYFYVEKPETDKRAALVRSEPVETRVTFAGAKRFLFDLNTGEKVGDTSVPLALELEPAWGRVILALPCESPKLNVTGPATARQGESTWFQLRLVDGAGKTVPVAATIQAQVQSPAGRVSPYSGYFAITDGVGEFILPLGINEEIGRWQVQFTGGFPRTTVACDLNVSTVGGGATLLLTIDDQEAARK